MSTQFVIAENEVDLRLDKLLSQKYPHYSRSYFQYLIESKAVSINGKPIKKKDKAEAGDQIDITLLQSPEIELQPEPIEFTVLFEDEHLIAVHKPAGLVVHPGAGNPNGTFINGLIYYLKQIPEGGDPLRPGLVHRLDKETSGVLLCAKTRECHTKLVDAFKERKMEKEYLALCKGVPKEGWIDEPIRRHPYRRQEMCVPQEGGKDAQTHIEVLYRELNHTFVRAKPKTGRTHQIRVHLTHLGAPILGDTIYGKEDKRLFLHAHRLTFTHPITKQKMSLTAPLPEEFKIGLDSFFKKSSQLILSMID